MDVPVPVSTRLGTRWHPAIPVPDINGITKSPPFNLCNPIPPHPHSSSLTLYNPILPLALSLSLSTHTHPMIRSPSPPPPLRLPLPPPLPPPLPTRPPLLPPPRSTLLFRAAPSSLVPRDIRLDPRSGRQQHFRLEPNRSARHVHCVELAQHRGQSRDARHRVPPLCCAPHPPLADPRRRARCEQRPS